MNPRTNAMSTFSYSVCRLMWKPYNIRKAYYPEQRKPTSSHSHDFPQLWYCVRGTFSLITDEKEYELKAGDFFVVPMGMHHIFLVPENTDTEIISADIIYTIFNDTNDDECINSKHGLFMHSFSSELRHPTPEPITLSKASRAMVQEYLSRLALNQLEGKNNETSETLSLLESIFSLPELIIPENSVARSKILWKEKILPILQIIKYVNENYNEKILIEDMLKISCLGHTTFFSIFKKITGYSFLSYLQQIRLLKCHLMMAETNFSMAYIAAYCGFCNQSHMERAYKKIFGKLPKNARAHSREWRKKNNILQKTFE